MSKGKQNHPKRNNMDTSLDTSARKDWDYFDKEHYEREGERLRRIEEESLNRLLNLTVEPQYRISISSPFRSELFKINIDGEADDLLLEELDELTNRIIHQSDIFIDAIRKKPSLILNDSIIQLAILKLQDNVYYGTRKSAKNAKDILSKAGIGAFIPKDTRQKKSKYDLIEISRNSPIFLFSSVRILKQRIQPYYKKGYRDDGEKLRELGNAYQKIFGKVMPTWLEKLILNEELYLQDFAIAFLSDQEKIDYKSLKRFYDSGEFKGRLRERLGKIGAFRNVNF